MTLDTHGGWVRQILNGSAHSRPRSSLSQQEKWTRSLCKVARRGLIAAAVIGLSACGDSDSIELNFSSTGLGGFSQCAIDVSLHNNSSSRLNQLQVQFGYEFNGRSYGGTEEFSNVGPGANAKVSNYNGPRVTTQADCIGLKPRIIAVGKCDLEGQREEACAKSVSLKEPSKEKRSNSQ